MGLWELELVTRYIEVYLNLTFICLQKTRRAALRPSSAPTRTCVSHSAGSVTGTRTVPTALTRVSKPGVVSREGLPCLLSVLLFVVTEHDSVLLLWNRTFSSI